MNFKETEKLVFDTTLKNLPSVLIDNGFVGIFDEKLTKRQMLTEIEKTYFGDNVPDKKPKAIDPIGVSFSEEPEKAKAKPAEVTFTTKDKLGNVPIASSKIKVDRDKNQDKEEEEAALESKDVAAPTDISEELKDNSELVKTGLSKEDLEKNIYNMELLMTNPSGISTSKRAFFADKVRRLKVELSKIEG